MKAALISMFPVELYLFLRRLNIRVFRKRYFNELQSMRRMVTTDGYSYKSFDEKKAIFIHIPKCAGISINTSLFGNLAGGHKRLDDYILIFGVEDFTNYFKFTFVRNPWDRVVSAYFFLKKGGLNEHDRKFFENQLSQYDGFSEFVRGWLTKENIYKYHHFKPQLFFLTDKYNKVSVDYIGYFENIEADFAYIAEKIGVENQLKKENSVKRKDYRLFYEEDTKKIVADVYEDDIQAFNYSFDGVQRFTRRI
jgi:hypothetical protein